MLRDLPEKKNNNEFENKNVYSNSVCITENRISTLTKVSVPCFQQQWYSHLDSSKCLYFRLLCLQHLYILHCCYLIIIGGTIMGLNCLNLDIRPIDSVLYTVFPKHLKVIITLCLVLQLF